MDNTHRCKCALDNYRVRYYKVMYTPFLVSGRKWATSEWSLVYCIKCGHKWRDKGEYVDKLKEYDGEGVPVR